MESFRRIKSAKGATIPINPMSPKFNVMPSSEYFEASSSVHEVGKRGQWNEKEYFTSNFKLENRFKGEELVEIGFRCMREIH